ncbi:PilW family protein [Acidovorax sp. JG5]|uniref:PilW family protein n=1 Tax=Acidovorax sp. JG5 TaxID=2822718 RepID=UPI001B32EC27|nr:PilW family protein [Acidovorax sp. JG5]MBP3980383.1 PilW family protein [Acidovorax sp. JG5]
MKNSNYCISVVRQQGRTLLELMISISIGLVVIGAVFVVYLGTTATSRQSSAINRINEDAAIAMAMLGNNLRMAGYSPPRALFSPGSAVVNGVKVTVPDRHYVGPAIRGCDFGFSSADNVAFDLITCNPASSPGPAAFVVRYEGDAFNTIPVSGNPSDCLTSGITTPNAESAYDENIEYKLVESRFSVGTSASNGTPELYCAGSGGAAPFTRQPLMQFVENMVLSYGIAEDNLGGNVVRYVTQTQLDAITPGSTDELWSRVVSVKLCLVLRSETRDQNGGGNYIDCAGNSVASPNGFIRRSFTSVFALRNRADFF